MVASPPREPMLHSVNFTDARKFSSSLFDEAVRDEQPVVIVRGKREHGMLVSRDSVARLLAPYRIQVDVLPEDDGGFTLWALELDVGGTGPTLASARDELLSAVRSYVRDYHQQFSFYRHLSDMAAKEPYVLRLSLAEDDAELIELLFGEQAAQVPPVPALAAAR